MYLLTIVATFAFLACAESGGFTYVRWGRKDCPSGAKLIYTGSTAGSHFAHEAGPATTLCLPKDPEYGSYTKNAHHRATIYGAEYEVHHQLTMYNGLHDQDVPCTLCKTRRSKKPVMMPAKTSCPKGWNTEYKGYLMSGHQHWSASEYLCVDEKAQALHYGHQNKDGHRLYLVEAVCNPLPCPPYKNYAELACVVCSQR